jgi:hypothetical protein
VVGGARLSPDPNVNLILIDLAQRESMNVSADFARLLYREAAPVFPFRPDWHRFAAFVVLKAPDIPSILFESGYLTNAVDAAYVQSPEGRQQIADGILRPVARRPPADRRRHAPRDRGPFRPAVRAAVDAPRGQWTYGPCGHSDAAAFRRS